MVLEFLTQTIKKKDISTISLILANLVPIIGIIFLNWNLFSTLIFYWSESVIIGLFNLIKIIKVPVSIIEIENKEIGTNTVKQKVGKTFFCIFFIIHYGIFMLVHLMFIVLLFGSKYSINHITDIIPIIKEIGLAVLFLLLSHGISYYHHFIKRKEYQNKNMMSLMIAPYKRIIVMHLTLIFGAFIVVLTNFPKIVIILFILIKTIVDLKAHNKEHEIIASI